MSLGTFATPERAARAYNEAAKEYGLSVTATPRRRWHCVDCDRRFIADDISAFVDHRKVQHWDEISPKEEARFLFRYAKRTGGDFASMRVTIDVAEKEKKDLDYLVAEGVLPREEVSSALWYRACVLARYDELVQKERRCQQFFAESGLVAQTEGLLRARDYMLRPFDCLIDAELAVLASNEAQNEAQKDCESGVNSQCPTADPVGG